MRSRPKENRCSRRSPPAFGTLAIRALRPRIVAIYALLVGLNVVVWGLALALFYHYPATLSVCLLAYGCGLRHAVDADHIAAIDNVTRKLMQENKRPVAVGFFFSLGHSTVVILLCLLVAVSTGFVKTRFPEYKEVGSLIGTSVSAAFLLLIAVINLIIFLEVYKAFLAARAGKWHDEDALQGLLNGRGLRPVSCDRCSGSSTKAGTCTSSAFCSAWGSTQLRRSP